MEIFLKSNIINDRFTRHVYDAFDIQDEAFSTIKIKGLEASELSKDYNVGLIVGSSGSGKTSILKSLGEIKKASFDDSKALISNFDWLQPEDAAKLLASFGLSSVPSWLRTFGVLSNGEQYRAALAYTIGRAEKGEVILIDEFTSVVDRNVAKAMSVAAQKYIRRKGLKVIFASCHFDIIDWLQPDFVYSPEKGGAPVWGDWLWCGQPVIDLHVARRSFEAWNLFKKHHYLTEDLNKAFGILTFSWDKQPVALVAFKPQPSGAVNNAYGLSRTVVLPDFQGMGIGSKVSEAVAAMLVNEGKRVFTKTVNPALGEYRNASKMWRPTSKNGRFRSDKDVQDTRAKSRLNRVSYCHEYTGPPLAGFEELLKPISYYKK